MPIPALTAEGFLPPGVHDCTLEELHREFGQFQRSDARPRLFRRLEAFIRDAIRTGYFCAIIVDGSFTTDIDSPNDIDLILVLRRGHDFAATTRPFEYNVLSRRQVRRIYRFDTLIGEDGSVEVDDHIRFFSQIRERDDLRKGMMRILL